MLESILLATVCVLLLCLIVAMHGRIRSMQRHISQLEKNADKNAEVLKLSGARIDCLLGADEIMWRAEQHADGVRTAMEMRNADQAEVEAKCEEILNSARIRADRYKKEYVVRLFNEETTGPQRYALDKLYAEQAQGGSDADPVAVKYWSREMTNEAFTAAWKSCYTIKARARRIFEHIRRRFFPVQF